MKGLFRKMNIVIVNTFIVRLSKGTLDLEQNGTHEKTAFSGINFHALAGGWCF